MDTYNYAKNLFTLLPQLYQIYDKNDGSLKDFMEALGETLDDMEQNISELYSDSFIESCHEWVIPYIGKLIGARLIESGGSGIRQEVLKTIHWRKQKGTLPSIEDIAKGITGRGVLASEFFEQIGWSQNLNHIKMDHLYSPLLTDHKALFNLGSADNKILHTIDIRNLCGGKGWFQIKNIGLFMAAAALSNYKKIPLAAVNNNLAVFTPEPQGSKVNLFDGVTRFPLSRIVSKKERFPNFGTGLTVDIYSRGILAATPEMPRWSGSTVYGDNNIASAVPDLDMLNLKNEYGLIPVDWNIENRRLGYEIIPQALCVRKGKANLVELGILDLLENKPQYKKTYTGKIDNKSRLVIRVKRKENCSSPFPGIVLKIQSENQGYEVYPEERKTGLNKQAAYYYLPDLKDGKKEMDFIMDRFGSAYYYEHNNNEGMPKDIDLFDYSKLARVTEGVVYPSRKLTASVKPYKTIFSLSAEHPIEVVDRGQFLKFLQSGEIEIKAWNRDNQENGGVLRPLASAKLSISAAGKLAVDNKTSNKECEFSGNLIISLHRQQPGKIPQMEIIIMDERGNSLLVYLPQEDNIDNAGKFYYAADNGASYRVNGDILSGGGTIVRLPPHSGPGGAFVKGQLARYSAGQVLPIEGEIPIRQRIPVRCELKEPSDIRSGLLVIDTDKGRIGFPKDEVPLLSSLTANFYHGLSAFLGAGAYFHSWEHINKERLIRVSKYYAPEDSNKYFCRHLSTQGDLPSKVRIFKKIQDAIDMALNGDCSSKELPWVIQIEDSEIYDEVIQISRPIPCGLVIRSAEFERPIWDGSIFWNASFNDITPFLSFNGLTITRTPEIQNGKFKKINFKDCTFLNERLIINSIQGENDQYPKLIIDNCILRDRITVHCPCDIEIKNSALDPDLNIESIVANKSRVSIERCT
ncbi:hypothetical protein HY745_03710, partial [Candidatus Desantisbacteria bacterium]|nr:hypothetical protein [Candidatus Desantisbacteria bacterium]